jgi:amidase
MTSITIEQSGAFIEKFTIPPTKDGPLRGLTFAVKDLIDVAGHRTGCGNPTWRASHPPAMVHAVCVEQLLAAGAQSEGKTITDEIAFSLMGENHHYGTPHNPAAPDRVPGGSSSGSASAVACGLVDFAIGTDTGGSVRVPASNCGIWGWRPSHDQISVAGVMPFAPTLDTVGVFTRDAELLQKIASVLLATEKSPAPTSASKNTIHLVREAFDVTDPAIRKTLHEPISQLHKILGMHVSENSLRHLCNDERAIDLMSWLTIYRVLQGTEYESNLGSWIADVKPTLGPAMLAGVESVKKLDRTRIGESVAIREHYSRQLSAALASGDLLCLPTAPALAPLKGSNSYDRSNDYYWRTLSINAISGIGRLTQICMPLAQVDGVPVGLSLVAGRGRDLALLEAASRIGKQLHGSPVQLQ